MLTLLTADMGFTNLVLPVPRAHKARFLVLLPANFSWQKHETTHLDLHWRLDTLHHYICLYDDICVQTSLSCVDIVGWDENARLLHQPKHILLGGGCDQYWPRSCDRLHSDPRIA